MEAFSFWVFSGVAIISAFLCISRRSPIASALWLVLTLFAIAALFVILQAHFIAAMQVLVYAGAIMVLFLFVIMLLHVGPTESSDLPGWKRRAFMIGLGAVLVVELWGVSKIVPVGAVPGTIERLTEQQGAVQIISKPLFSYYLVPFEITSVLLLAAIVGAVVLAKRRL